MIADTTRQEIERALAAGDIAAAARCAGTALSAGELDPLLLNLAAWAAEEAGDFVDAQALLDRALALAPGDATIHTGLGDLHLKQGRLGEAARAYDAALGFDAGAAAAWLGRARVFEAAGSFEQALADYARAAELEPGAAALAGVATVASRLGRTAEARAAADRALALDPNDATAICAAARCDIDVGDPAKAVTALRALTGGALAPDLAIVANGLLGDALDRLGDTGEAFAAFKAANAAFGTRHCRADPNVPSHTAFIDNIERQVRDLGPAAFAPTASPPAKDQAARHVILTGYPRSGTTLVETALASLDDVDALEERATLRDADAAFLAEPSGLARLAEADAQHYRDAYWRRVRDAGVHATGRTFVDMDPLKSIKLPLIARLFPEARVVLMRRDPRDIVLSCVRTGFAPTAAACEFLSVESAARHYNAVMRLTELCVETLPLDVHVLRYDALVADFDTTTRALCQFIGIDWSPKLRDFARTAERRGVATASAAQVRKPLYDGGGQWRRYADELAPALPILAPWVEKFGFAPT